MFHQVLCRFNQQQGIMLGLTFLFNNEMNINVNVDVLTSFYTGMHAAWCWAVSVDAV
jgi:hypothetical protein